MKISLRFNMSISAGRRNQRAGSRNRGTPPELAPFRPLHCQCRSVSKFLLRLGDPRQLPIHTRVAIVVAHPDDESIGVGAHLPLLRNAILIHLTDGAPRNLADANRLGFPDAHSYAQARKEELEEIIVLAGISKERCIQLGVPDQEASLCLGKITRRLAALFSRNRPELVLTHPYEGGHPDHDAAAFCVHSAVALLPNPVPILEMAFYHRKEGRFVTGEFLPNSVNKPVPIRLSQSGREFKRELYRRYRTQESVLKAFRIEKELFREAPPYDFTKAPPVGGLCEAARGKPSVATGGPTEATYRVLDDLHYDHNDFRISGPQFRALVRLAIHELQLGAAK
jgi:LmbE family N-acetylglucosaminyl deacetylase